MDNKNLITLMGIHVRTWHSEIEFEMILLRTYIERVECQIAESIDDYHSKKKTSTIHVDPDEGWADTVTEYSGVNDSTYDLDSIFEEYFPDLQRGSALMTLFSFFEHQLNDLCKRFSNEGKVAVKFEDFPPMDRGIVRSTKYLKDEVGLSKIRGSLAWEEIKNIQSVRNTITHTGGGLKGHVEAPKDYLPSVIETFASYFKEINELITRTDCA